MLQGTIVCRLAIGPFKVVNCWAKAELHTGWRSTARNCHSQQKLSDWHRLKRSGWVWRKKHTLINRPLICIECVCVCWVTVGHVGWLRFQSDSDHFNSLWSLLLIFCFYLHSLNIKGKSGHLAESRYLAQTWPPLPMADPEHPLTHLLRGELWTWGPAWSDSETSPARHRSPRGDFLSLPSASLPSSPFFLPFHLQTIAGSEPLHPGIWWIRGGKLQTDWERIWEKAE